MFIDYKISRQRDANAVTHPNVTVQQNGKSYNEIDDKNRRLQ